MIALMLRRSENKGGQKFFSPAPRRNNRCLGLILGTAALSGHLFWYAKSDAQVVTNITSSGLNTAVAQAGTTHTITGGTRPGGGQNLFHSFGIFNIGAGDTANFSNDTGLATTNILARVNGGQASNIFGRIQTAANFGAANLFLINPAGWLFGAGASLSVAGAFHATTADYVRFPDVAGAQVRFNADNSALPANGLTVNPSAFGFLSATPVRIAVEGATLQVAANKTLALVSGEAPFTGQVETGLKIAGVGATGATSTLRASGAQGQIQIVSVASAGEMVLGANPDVSSFATLGQVRLTNGSNVASVGVLDVSGTAANPAGSILIRGGRLVADQSAKMFARNIGAGAATATAVDVRLTGDLTLGGGSGIEVRASGAGAAGVVNLSAANFELKEASFIQSINTNAGAGGDITANVQTAAIRSGSSILTRSDRVLVPPSAGAAGGDVTINATGSVVIDGANSTLNSTTNSNRAGGAGIGGNLTVNAASLDITNGASMNTVSTGTGAGGNMLVQVADLNIASTGSLFSRTATAQGGSVTVNTTGSTVTISGASSGIFSGSSNTGAAGAVSVNTAQLTIDGGQIGSGTRGIDTQGGSLTINATQSIDILNGGSIRSRAFNQNVAPVTISTPSLTINGGSLDTSTSQNGAAGNIIVNGGSNGTVTLINGGQIISNSALSASGSGGSVTVNTGDLTISNTSANGVPVTNFNNSPNSGIFSTASGSGAGGNINIQAAGSVVLENGGTISAQSTGAATATAGNVNITAGELVRLQGSSITTGATLADGGNISITTTGSLVQLTDSQIITSVESGVGGGGNISINSELVTLNNSEVRADAFGGPGGNINIVADVFLTSGSLLSASSALSTPGTINIEAVVTDVSGEVGQLPETPLQANELLRASCAARFAGGKASSLVLGGRDGVPIQPGGLLPSPLYLATDSGNPTTGMKTSANDPHARFSLVSVDSKHRLLTQYSLLPNSKCAF
jgi:filamentous hemagglutinin family protein